MTRVSTNSSFLYSLGVILFAASNSYKNTLQELCLKGGKYDFLARLYIIDNPHGG